ncbi:hypothetical protein EI94DRAFT_1713728 [Lactarius quietus]|nr:hypothetical protein EI94DRAFT_1713728 [Lactarius quietus]
MTTTTTLFLLVIRITRVLCTIAALGTRPSITATLQPGPLQPGLPHLLTTVMVTIARVQLTLERLLRHSHPLARRLPNTNIPTLALMFPRTYIPELSLICGPRLWLSRPTFALRNQPV